MANNLAGNPWYIDTPGATVLKAGRTFVSGIEWSGYNAQADQVTVQDGKRLDTVLNWVGANDLEPRSYPGSCVIYDIIVPVLSGGVLKIFLR